MTNAYIFKLTGGVLLSRILRWSTIGAGKFHFRVRNGIGWEPSAITTGNYNIMKKKLIFNYEFSFFFYNNLMFNFNIKKASIFIVISFFFISFFIFNLNDFFTLNSIIENNNLLLEYVEKNKYFAIFLLYSILFVLDFAFYLIQQACLFYL